MKKTPWFSGDVEPVRDGIYETKIAGIPSSYMRVWSHGLWWYDGGHVFVVCAIQYRKWRGLAEQPK